MLEPKVKMSMFRGEKAKLGDRIKGEVPIYTEIFKKVLHTSLQEDLVFRCQQSFVENTRAARKQLCRPIR